MLQPIDMHSDGAPQRLFQTQRFLQAKPRQHHDFLSNRVVSGLVQNDVFLYVTMIEVWGARGLVPMSWTGAGASFHTVRYAAIPAHCILVWTMQSTCRAELKLSSPVYFLVLPTSSPDKAAHFTMYSMLAGLHMSTSSRPRLSSATKHTVCNCTIMEGLLPQFLCSFCCSDFLPSLHLSLSPLTSDLLYV